MCCGENSVDPGQLVSDIGKEVICESVLFS